MLSSGSGMAYFNPQHHNRTTNQHCLGVPQSHTQYTGLLKLSAFSKNSEALYKNYVGLHKKHNEIQKIILSRV
jgi:hypothetical protein